MNQPNTLSHCFSARLAAALVTTIFLLASSAANAVTTALANNPVRATSKVPANVMLALGVEWPTGVVQSYNDEVTSACPGRDGSSDSICYTASRTYIGYFDPFKCYTYDTSVNYFKPVGYTAGASAALLNGGSKTCSGNWSGNFLNWATMQTTDMFRFAMTGGDRYIDTATNTVLEKARHDGQGGFGQFPIKRIGGANVGASPVIQPVLPSTVTPFTYGQLFVRIQGMNTVMWVSKARSPVTGNHPLATNNPNNTLDVPAASVQTFTEEGLCAAYVGPGTCSQVTTASPGTRQITAPVTSVNEAGQCPVAGSVSCVNTAAPGAGTRQYQYTRTAAGVTCPSSDPNQTACTQSSIGTRTASLTEGGQCPFPAAPAGTTYSVCSNTTLPTSTVSRLENGTQSCASVTNPAGTVFVSCTPGSGGTRQYLLTEPGQSPCPTAPAGTTYSGCANVATPTSTVTRAETGTCATVTNPAGTVLVSCLDVAGGTRSFTVTEPGQVPCNTAPAGSTYSGCANATPPTSTVTRLESGTNSCVLGTIVNPGGTVFVSCTAGSAGTRSYTLTETGSCPPPAPPGGTTYASCSTVAGRTYVYRESGNCGSLIPPSGFTNCSNAGGGNRNVTVLELGSCPRTPSGGQTLVSCTNVTSRTYTVTEPGQTPCSAAPAGKIFGTCSNATAPTRTIVRTETGTCATVAGGFASCAVASTGTRSFTNLEPGQCPAGSPPGGTTYGACSNVGSPTRTVVRTENGTCATVAGGSTSCVAAFAGTRSYTVLESGQCPLGAPPSGTTFGSCSNVGAPNRTVVRTENGTCATVAAGSTSCAAATPGSRTYTSLEPGQCPRPSVAGVTVNTCSNTTQPQITVTAVSTGQCAATIPAGGTLVAGSCTNLVASDLGTRTVVRNAVTVEAGQCATYVGTGTCVNLTAPILADIRQITGESVSVSAYYVRVKVCDPAFPESQATCTVYGNGTSIKPTGSIQDNALNMRFGAFGYLLDNSSTRDGGVLRARMKDVGPTLAQYPSTTNPAAEWSATTGVYVNNPDAADATATGFGATNSGVINYLNKFGRLNGYKSFDPYAEMYAEVIKYFKGNKLPSTQYSNNLNSTMVDGFPVITNWNDPIQFSCQQNFVIGIEDANQHKDKNLSGGVTNAESEPSTLPTNVDTDYNVTTWTNTVGTIETSSNPPIANPSGGTVTNNLATLRNCCNGTAFLAGLAYYAHTTDLRADFDNLNGPQTLTSFFVDVREAGSWGTSGDPRNQLWLAAKYGGFKDLNKNGVFDALDTWADSTQGTVQGYPVPTNYFAANQPEKLVAGLNNAFQQILGQTGSGAGVGVAASNLSQTTGENGIYQVKFDTTDWSGTVSGFTIRLIDPVTGAIALNNATFEAGALLLTKAAGTGWDTGRVIVTAVSGGTQLGQPFRVANLNAAQLTSLGPTAGEQQDVLNYIRGDKSKEEATAAGVAIVGGKYRVRTKLLADIVDSEAVYVGKPGGEYLDQFNPGYAAFKTAKAARLPVIYVGANAGQLHAFNAVVDPADTNIANAGKEIMAFVPSLTYAGPNNTPIVDGLRSLTLTNTFVHHYFVNATPSVRDVDFNTVDGRMTTTPDWHSLLVGGLGKGGRGYYALDVTDPSALTTEASAATKVLWEFTDEDMGFSYGLPLITKSRKWGWVVMVSSGYNNITSSVVANQGKGFLYILNAATGALLQKIGTGVGTTASPSGFSPISAYTPSFADYTTDEVYGGDLLGNVWRFDLRSATANVPAPLQFASLTSPAPSIAPQPITTLPLIEYSVADGKRYVFVGTGRFLDTSDIQNAQQQTFYAIRDGTIDLRYETTASITGQALPSGVSFPITRANLANNTNLVTGLTTTQIAANPMGWYYELLGFAPASGTVLSRERISLNPKASQGYVTWVGNVPDANTCNPDGVSRQYACTYGGCKSLLYTTDSAGVRTYTDAIQTQALVKSQLVNVGDSVRILGTNAQGIPFLIGNPLNAFGAGRLLNWREVLQ